jgi:hypothetical protein
MGAKELYDVDFFQWAQQNAELLHRGCADAADLEHIAEELEDMAKRDQREVQSFLRRLILHLLKWQLQPAKRSRSWERSIANSRVQLKGIFKQSPSLKHFAEEAVGEVYSDALRLAAIETGLDRKRFPPRSPYSFAQIMDADYLPED